MNPVKTQRRRVGCADGGRRPGMARNPAQPATLFDAPKEPACAHTRHVEVAGSDGSLDRIMVESWERLTSRAPTPCLLCGGAMEPVYGANARPIGGSCCDCGTTLS